MLQTHLFSLWTQQIWGQKENISELSIKNEFAEKQTKQQTDLIKTLQKVITQYEDREQQQKEKDQQRKKRKNRTRLPKREPISENDFIELKKYIRSREDLVYLTKCRYFVFYIVMFLTEVRIMEAANITFSVADDLFEKQRAYIEIHQKKQKKEACAHINPSKSYLVNDVANEYRSIKKHSGGVGFIVYLSETINVMHSDPLF